MRATFLVNRSVHTYIHFDLTVRSIVHIVVYREGEKERGAARNIRKERDRSQRRSKCE